jgi:hypothetical protein
MNYEPLTWYEQEYLRYKAHFDALPREPCSLRLFTLKFLSKFISSPKILNANQMLVTFRTLQ